MACGDIDFPVITEGRKNVIWFQNRLYHKNVLFPRRSECVLVRVLFVLSMQSQCDTHHETHEQYEFGQVLIFFVLSIDDVKLLSSVIAVVVSLQMQKYSKSIINISNLQNTLGLLLYAFTQGLINRNYTCYCGLCVHYAARSFSCHCHTTLTIPRKEFN